MGLCITSVDILRSHCGDHATISLVRVDHNITTRRTNFGELPLPWLLLKSDGQGPMPPLLSKSDIWEWEWRWTLVHMAIQNEMATQAIIHI